MKYTTTDAKIQKALQDAGITEYTYCKQKKEHSTEVLSSVTHGCKNYFSKTELITTFDVTIICEGINSKSIVDSVLTYCFKTGAINPTILENKGAANIIIPYPDEVRMDYFNSWFYKEIKQPKYKNKLNENLELSLPKEENKSEERNISFSNL